MAACMIQTTGDSRVQRGQYLKRQVALDAGALDVESIIN